MQKQVDEHLSSDPDTCIDSNYTQKVLALLVRIS
jgi:hypothetical protein